MTALQWALLIVGAVAVIAIYVASRRRSAPAREPRPRPAAAPAPRLPTADQLDMFVRNASEYDEFGVGKPRKRSAPTTDTPAERETRTLFPGVDVPPAARKEKQAPSFLKAESAKPPEEMIVTLLIAEREGTAIFGPKIHLALAEQSLQFGEKKIYHRLSGGQAVFSVASLVKPGFLDPGEQQGFSTPGLTVFMVLPGPVKPLAALKDMIATARGLARALNAEVFDVGRQVFDEDAARGLTGSVEAWVQRNA